MLIDARRIEPNRQFLCDVCVVGAGPAGIALVDRLRQSGLAVILVESGGFNLELATQSLYQGDIVGQPYFRLDACRWRLFGGSSVRWGGWCRPLEADDYEIRDWIPLSGWPITASDLRPYHDDAAALFQLPNAQFDLEHWRDRMPRPLPLDGTDLQNTVFQHSPETDFGYTYRERILAAPNVTTLIHANLTQIRLAPGTQRVDTLEIATLNGRRFTIQPRTTVIAAGGIENARLLLASTADRPMGVGNEHDMVGRCFMEHLHVPVGHILASPRTDWDQAYFGKAIFQDVRLRGVLTPRAHALREHQLLSTSIAIEKASYSFGTPYIGWPPPVTFGPVKLYRAYRHGAAGPVAEYVKHSVERLQSLYRRMRTRRIAQRVRERVGPQHDGHPLYAVYFRAEQAPDKDNRVTLSDQRDALGMPKTRLIWAVKDLDRHSVEGWLRVLDQTLRSRQLGQVVQPTPDWVEDVIGGPHHMGTTRMSADPRTGVVDANCKVHTVDNLYMAGSSVYATSGYVNPTYSLVLLALRLADHLRQTLQSQGAPEARNNPVMQIRGHST